MPVTKQRVKDKISEIAGGLELLLSALSEDSDMNRVIQLLRTADMRVRRAVEVAMMKKEEVSDEEVEVKE